MQTLVNSGLRETDARTTVFIGHDACAFEALCAGVDGWISGSPIVFPRLTVQIFNLVQERHWTEARALWSRLTEFIRLEFGPYPVELPSVHIIAVVKAALIALGDDVGDPLPPIQPLRGAELEYVRHVALALGELERSLSLEQSR